MPSNRVSLVLLAAGAFLGGCNSARRDAEAEIHAADSAVSAVDQMAAKVAPERTGELSTSLTAARTAFETGDYPAAAQGAREVQARAQALADSVPARRAALTADLQLLSEAMPRNLDSVRLRIDRAARGQRPRGLTREGLDSVRAIHDSARQAWPGIQAMIDSGDLAAAFAQAIQLRNRVSAAMVALGLAADQRAWGNLQLAPDSAR